ncbi:hypothetical protein HNQ79_006740, partial [Streptomyces candidus]|nr:hypothetical protein [Streptomyces candidus]
AVQPLPLKPVRLSVPADKLAGHTP